MDFMSCGVNTTIGIIDNMPTGKFQGESVQHVINTDPGHILWLNKNNLLTFTREVLKEAQRMNSYKVEFGYDTDVPQ